MKIVWHIPQFRSNNGDLVEHSITYNLLVLAGVVALAFAVRYVILAAQGVESSSPWFLMMMMTVFDTPPLAELYYFAVFSVSVSSRPPSPINYSALLAYSSVSFDFCQLWMRKGGNSIEIVVIAGRLRVRLKFLMIREYLRDTTSFHGETKIQSTPWKLLIIYTSSLFCSLLYRLQKFSGYCIRLQWATRCQGNLFLICVVKVVDWLGVLDWHLDSLKCNLAADHCIGGKYRYRTESAALPS